MFNAHNTDTGCQIVGEFTDDNGGPEFPASNQAEPERPRIIADVVDDGDQIAETRPFTVLLKDGRSITVRGHGLLHELHSLPGQDVFSVFVQTKTREILVACFKGEEITGIFHGELEAGRKIA